MITAYTPLYWTVGKKRRIVLDSVVQEIDVRDRPGPVPVGRLDHVPLSSSYEGVPRSRYHPYDYFHVNSIQQDTDGNLIVSSRDTFAAYKINHNTGQVMWILGGKRSSFKMGRGARFAFQHDVRVYGNADNTVTLFDDGGGPPRVHRWARGLTLALNFRHMTATKIGQDEHSPRLSPNFEGNDQVLPGGDHFVGWGQFPYFTEFNSRGRTVFDGHFVDANANYRAYKFPWTGRPQYPPSVAANERRPYDRVGELERGQTAARRWRVFGGRRPNSLERSGPSGSAASRPQFESGRERYVKVQALDGKGKPLKTSRCARAVAHGRSDRHRHGLQNLFDQRSYVRQPSPSLIRLTAALAAVACASAVLAAAAQAAPRSARTSGPAPGVTSRSQSSRPRRSRC